MSRGPMRLNAADPDFDARFDQLLSLKREADADVGADVAAIIDDVRTNGDEALFRADYLAAVRAYEAVRRRLDAQGGRPGQSIAPIVGQTPRCQ